MPRDRPNCSQTITILPDATHILIDSHGQGRLTIRNTEGSSGSVLFKVPIQGIQIKSNANQYVNVHPVYGIVGIGQGKV